ncbi:MAG: DUF4340 domain-containing protein, partial [Arenicellales bacterium]
MRSKRSFLILVGITILVVVAAVFSQRSANEPPPAYGLQAPDLASKVGDVHTVVISKADGSLRLARTKDGWVARSKDNYPADGDRIRHLVLGISQMHRLEKKTSDPARYARLKLQDIDKPGSEAVQITCLTKDNKKLASVLVGKTRDFETTTESKYFVRNAGDPQSWLAEGTLPPVLGNLSDWLQKKLMPGVGGSDIRSVAVTEAGSETVTVKRDSSDKRKFDLVGLGKDEQISNQYSLNAIPETLQGLSLKDVAELDSLKDKSVVLTLDAWTFNGVKIVARFGHLGKNYSARLEASYDPARDETAAGKPSRGSGGQGEGTAAVESGQGSGGREDKSSGEGRQAAGGAGAENAGEKGNPKGQDHEGQDEKKKQKKAMSGKELAQSLNERWRGRFFVV